MIYDKQATNQLLDNYRRELNNLYRLSEIGAKVQANPLYEDLKHIRENTPFPQERMTALTLEARAKQLTQR